MDTLQDESPPGNRGRLLRLGAEFMKACDAEHRAKTFGDAEATASAHFARLAAAARIDAEQDRIAEDWLSGIALAIDRRPHEIRDLMLPFLAATLTPLWNDMKSLAAAVARLERRAA